MNRKQYLLENIKSFLITLLPAFAMIYFAHLILVFDSTLAHQFEMFNLILSLSLIALSLVYFATYTFIIKRQVPDKINKIIKSTSFMMTGLLLWVVATNLLFIAAFTGIINATGPYFHSVMWSMAWVIIIVISISFGVIKYFINIDNEEVFNHKYRVTRNTGLFLSGSMLAIILLGDYGVVTWGASIDAQFVTTYQWQTTVINPIPPINITLDSWRMYSFSVLDANFNNENNAVTGGWQAYLLCIVYFSLVLTTIQVFILAYFRKIKINNKNIKNLPLADRKVSQDWYLFFSSTLAIAIGSLYFINEYLLFPHFAQLTLNGIPLADVGATTAIGWLLGSGMKPDFAGSVEGQLVTTYHSVDMFVKGNVAFGATMFSITNLIFISILAGMPFAYIKENKITTKNWKEHFVIGGHK